MAGILRVLKQVLLYPWRTNESDGENVGRGDAAYRGGAIAGSADVLEKDKKSVGDFSGAIRSIEPKDESKYDAGITGEAVEAHTEACDGLKATEEVHNTNQGLPESSGGLPSAPLKRGLRRVATPVLDSDVQRATKRSKRAKDWTAQETESLITRKLQPSLPKGTLGWELISSEIPGRSSRQCRQRWDTVQKLCKKIEDYCVDHGKEFSEVSKEELLSMKLGMTFFTNVHWYKMIDDSSSRPTIATSGPAANDLNGGSTSSHPVGEPDLPSSACPNLKVPLLELTSTANPVEQSPAALELAGWSEDAEASIFIDRYLVALKFKKHQKCEGSKLLLLNLWWLHVTFSFMVN